MGLEVDIRTEGTTQITAHLDVLIKKFDNIEDVWPLVRDAVLQYEQEYLESRGFGTFPELKPSTLKRKNRRSSTPFDTTSHRMWDSFIGAGPDFIYQVSGNVMEIGVRGGPAHWHMLDRKHMSARPPIRMTPKLRRMVKQVFKNYAHP